MAATKRMYVWYELPSLRDYSNGMMSVIATSKDQALKLAVDHHTGKLRANPSAHDLQRRSKILEELMAEDPEVISLGAASILGGS